MIKKITISLLTILFLYIIVQFNHTNSIPASSSQSLLHRTIVIDPGHGGLDNGAIVKKVKEDELNLNISFALKNELESRGATVYLTRDDDHDLTNRDHHYSKQDDMYLRVRKIDSYQPDLFISIHVNTSPVSSTWGSQVFYYQKSESSKMLADQIHQSMLKVTGSKKNVETANFYVLKNTKASGVLIECGFISNPNERGQLTSKKYQEKLASSISDGIEQYLKY